MRILIAPDKFKGTLSAKDAATAIARGVRRAAEERGVAVEIDEFPVADGGEGFLDCVARVKQGKTQLHRVMGPLDLIEARLFVSPPRSIDDVSIDALALRHRKGRTLPQVVQKLAREFLQTPCECFIEAADAVGVRHLSFEQRDPELTTTSGLGQLIDNAIDLFATHVVVGLGGSSTVDGGTGAAATLRVKFLDGRGSPILAMSGGRLAEVKKITPLPEEHPIRDTVITALCDVTNPLLGPHGAARVFGPQKGATPEQVERLEAGLTNLVKVCRECGIPCDPDQPGAGSAGGLGFGLATFLGAKLVPGAPFIFDLLKFDERVAKADLVITGEGRLDSQTASGKAAAEVARRAARAGKPCLAVVGSTEGSAQQAREVLDRASITFDGVASAAEAAGSPQAALQQPAKWVQEAGYRAMSEFLSQARA